MTSSLATKQDLAHLEQLMVTRLDALETRVALMNQNVESRIVFKLGALMVVLFGLAGTMLKVMG
jgi:hypothetical protein